MTVPPLLNPQQSKSVKRQQTNNKKEQRRRRKRNIGVYKDGVIETYKVEENKKGFLRIGEKLEKCKFPPKDNFFHNHGFSLPDQPTNNYFQQNSKHPTNVFIHNC